ncbi:MAG: hypothetical protein IJ611_07295 [Bacteroidales bacterium]|nr:hypothetical protein [Bacteroidales bacterium]
MRYKGNAKKRNSLCVELLFLMLVSSRFFDMIPFEPILAGGGQIFLMLGTMAVIYMTQLGFQLRTGILKRMNTVWWILGGLALSYIAAYRYYHQPFYLSFVVNRHFFTLVLFPLLLAVRPTYRELKWAVYAFSIICVVATFYISFVDQSLVPVNEFMPFIEDGDFVHALSGLHFVLIAFIFSLYEFRNKLSVRKLIPVILLFLFIFIARNRTFLIASCLILALSVLSNRSSRSRLYAFTIMSFVVGVVTIVLVDTITSLLQETMDQLSDPDYNRIKAILYAFSLPNGKASILIGNGFISGNFNSIVNDLRQEGIFYSDIGLIGLWHVYGLLPVIAILASVIRGLSANHSLEVRGNALLILTCSLTVGYFASIETLTWLSLYLYFLYSDQEYARAVERRRNEITKELMRRYRSLLN